MTSHSKQLSAIIERAQPVVTFQLAVTKARGNKVEMMTEGVIVFFESNGATDHVPQVTFEVHASEARRANTRPVVREHHYGLQQSVAAALAVVSHWKFLDAIKNTGAAT